MEILGYLLVVYAFILLLNGIISFFIWRIYRGEPFIYLPLYWLAAAVCFFAQGIAGENLTGINISSIFLIISILIVAIVIPSGEFKKKTFLTYFGSQVVSVILAIILTQSGFPTWSVLLLPVVVMVVAQLHGASIVWRDSRSSISTIYALLLIAAALNIASFPFLRFVESYAPIGFTIGICNALSFAIVLPAYVLEVYLKVKNKEKDKEFETLFNILSHDIANPLTSLGAGLDILFGKKELSEAREEEVKVRIKRAYISMVDILKHVRELRNFETESISVEFKRMDLKNLLEEVLEDLSHQLEQKSISTVHNLDKYEIIEVESHRETLKNQVLLNILSNAIKFSEEKSRIEIILETEGEKVIVRIKDYGKGISEEMKENLFDFQTNSTTLGTNGEKGSGLGMPIMSRHANLLNIDVSVVSEPDLPEGTEFKLTWT